MHRFFRTVGYARVESDREARDILEDMLLRCRDAVHHIAMRNGDRLWELRVPLGDRLGIAMGGYVGEGGKLIRERYLPYIDVDEMTSTAECMIERHVDNEVYSGLIDDMRIGISLIFRLTNVAEYRQQRALAKYSLPRGVALGGLSRDGKILLPVYKNDRQRELLHMTERERARMISAAKEGDENAMKNLTNSDLRLYESVNRRLRQEDIYSIVDSCFMPDGIECDLYVVIGEIQQISQRKNRDTGELIWDFLIRSHDLPFHVYINTLDLQGEPKVGRRFKGIVWMQGKAIW